MSIPNYNFITYEVVRNEKVVITTIKKNEPAYLAAWVGTKENSLSSLHSENGKLPEGLEEAEFALLYKVGLTDQEEQ